MLDIQEMRIFSREHFALLSSLVWDRVAYCQARMEAADEEWLENGWGDQLHKALELADLLKEHDLLTEECH